MSDKEDLGKRLEREFESVTEEQLEKEFNQASKGRAGLVGGPKSAGENHYGNRFWDSRGDFHYSDDLPGDDGMEPGDAGGVQSATGDLLADHGTAVPQLCVLPSDGGIGRQQEDRQETKKGTPQVYGRD
jgi:hypothetical protein